MKREHPTCTERQSLVEECGWKGGDSRATRLETNLIQWRTKEPTWIRPAFSWKAFTLIDLAGGVSVSGWLWVNVPKIPSRLGFPTIHSSVRN